MRSLRDAHTALDLKPRQFELLAVLHDKGPLGQGELGQIMGVDPSILVTLLNPLEADGFVSRDRDPTDRRRHVVSLTSSGGRHLDNAARAQREVEDDLFAGLDDAQREQLRSLLITIRDTLAPGEGPECAGDSPADDC